MLCLSSHDCFHLNANGVFRKQSRGYVRHCAIECKFWIGLPPPVGSPDWFHGVALLLFICTFGTEAETVARWFSSEIPRLVGRPLFWVMKSWIGLLKREVETKTGNGAITLGVLCQYSPHDLTIRIVSMLCLMCLLCRDKPYGIVAAPFLSAVWVS